MGGFTERRRSSRTTKQPIGAHATNAKEASGEYGCVELQHKALKPKRSACVPTAKPGTQMARRPAKADAPTNRAPLPLLSAKREEGSDAHVRIGAGGKTGNDPSAGSPTETLLRLLLPLNDKVRTASRGVAAGEPAAAPQSGGLTGSFNR